MSHADFTSVEIDGNPTGLKVVYGTVVDQSSLYRAMAQIGSNYYATVDDALTARRTGAASGEISILVDPATITIPNGYEVRDGKLKRKVTVLIFN